MVKTDCDFKKLVDKRLWTFAPGKGRMRGPDYAGEDYGPHPIKRCPLCHRRLQLKVIHCIGGEFVCWRIPDHNQRVTRRPGPRRISRYVGRGK